MTIELTLYQGAAGRFFGDYDLSPVLRRMARLRFGDRARHGQIQFLLDGPEDLDPYPGPPEVHNLNPQLGYCQLRILRGGETVCEERLRVVEALGPVLAEDLREFEPDETHWGFTVQHRQPLAVVIAENLIEAITRKLVGEERPAPEIAGSVDVDLDEQRHRPFTLTQLAAADVESVSAESLGLDQERLGRLNILMSKKIHDHFLVDMPLADRMEEGGFLFGRVTRVGDDRHLVEITHVTPAHRSGAGLVHFTFTGESFLAAAKLLEERGQGEELVGWYHTHLLGVDFDMGLSSIDVDLHLATFQRPWQVAALVNIQRRGRVLRIYGRDENGLKEYDQWISDDGRRYRPADHAVGGE